MNKKYLKNKTAIVTGSSRGIGYEIAKKLALSGAFVEMCGSSDIQIDALNDSISNYTQVDFANPDAVDSYSEALLSSYSSIQVLVNNAGIGNFMPFKLFTFEEYNRIMQINLHSAFQLTQKLLPLLEAKGGLIVNIASIAVPQTFKNSSIYAASKAALAKMFIVAREELRNKNIGVINVYPGATATEIWDMDFLRESKSKMMTAVDVANVTCNAIENSIQGNLLIEEIYLRPKTGDLS